MKKLLIPIFIIGLLIGGTTLALADTDDNASEEDADALCLQLFPGDPVPEVCECHNPYGCYVDNDEPATADDFKEPVTVDDESGGGDEDCDK